jgi:Mce-associated membrane protein
MAVPSETDTSTEDHDIEYGTVEPGDGRATASPDDVDVDDDDAMKAEDELSSESGAARDVDDSENGLDPSNGEATKKRRPVSRSKVFAFVVLPALALLLACAAGYLKWLNMSDHSATIARVESAAAAKDATISLLSYKPDTAEKDLDAARDRLTGTFKDSYTQLTHDVVIPGAKEKHISSTATVPAVASVKATANHAVVLLYVDQTTVVGADTPSDSVSTVRVTLDNIRGRWLVSEFDPL